MKKRNSIILSALLFFTVFLNPIQVRAEALYFPVVGKLTEVSTDRASAEFSHDDQYILTAHDRMGVSKIAVWNADNTSLITSWDVEIDGYLRMAIYNHDSTKIISADSKSVIKVWDTASGNLLNTFKSRKEGKGEIRDLLVNEDSTILYVANGNNVVSFIDLNSGEILEELNFSSSASSLAYNPKDEELAILSSGRSLHIRDAKDGSYIVSKEITGRKNNIEYTSDYKILFLTNDQEQPTLFDVEDSYRPVPLKEEDYRMKYGNIYTDSGWSSFEMTPNDRYVFATGRQIRDGINIYDTKTRRFVQSIRGSNLSKIKINHSVNRLLIADRLIDISQLPDRDTIGISLNFDSESQEISVQEIFNDGTYRDLDLSAVKLTTSNPDVIRILYGQLQSYEEGTAIITAEYKGFKDDLEIEVTIKTGWQEVENTWYYLDSSGEVQTGWTKVGNTWYYMTSSGAMQTGWIKLGRTWYYLNNNGAMQTQNTTINGTWYRFDSSGRMR